MAHLLDPTRYWTCPSCQREIKTTDTSNEPRLHPCKALKGLLAPFVENGAMKSRHVIVEREDYVGSELVQTDDTGRPVAAIDVQRVDGSNDRAVLPPTAVVEFEAIRHLTTRSY